MRPDASGAGSLVAAVDLDRGLGGCGRVLDAVDGEEEADRRAHGLAVRLAHVGVDERLAIHERAVRLSFGGGHLLRPADEHDAAQARLAVLARGHVQRRRGHASLLALRVPRDRLHGVMAGRQVGQPIEEDVAAARGVELVGGGAQQVVLAQPVHLVAGVVLHPRHHGEVRLMHPVGALVLLVELIGDRAARHLHENGNEPGLLRGGEAESHRLERERVRLRGGVELSDGRRLVRAQRRRLHGPDREVALACLDLDAGPAHLHGDRPELAVVALVGRRVAEEVVEAHVLLDAAEGGGGVVGVVDQEAAGLVGKLAQAALRVEPQQILVALEGAGHDPVGGVVAAGLHLPHPPLGRLHHLLAGFLVHALGAQAARVHRVDAHVGPVGVGDDRPELCLDVGRDREALGEEDNRFTPRQALEAVHHREEAVGRGVSLLVALEGLEGAEHPDLYLADRLGDRSGGGGRRDTGA